MSVGNDLGKSRSTTKPGIAGIAMTVLPCYWMKVLPCYSCSYVQVRRCDLRELSDLVPFRPLIVPSLHSGATALSLQVTKLLT